MPARIATSPKLTARGTTIVASEVSPETRQGLVAIAKRRGETLNTVTSKALEQYVAADRRRK